PDSSPLSLHDALPIWLRPGQDDDFTVDTGEGLIAFWGRLTRVIFTVVPAVVAIGIVVGGIVIMNIMLMSVTERTREIGILKSLRSEEHTSELQSRSDL